jgi:hypothetical protein
MISPFNFVFEDPRIILNLSKILVNKNSSFYETNSKLFEKSNSLRIYHYEGKAVEHTDIEIVTANFEVKNKVLTFETKEIQKQFSEYDYREYQNDGLVFLGSSKKLSNLSINNYEVDKLHIRDWVFARQRY